jgi:hypothetical protein
MEQGGNWRTALQKGLAVNQRVSGAVGEFYEGPSAKRRPRQCWFGHVVRAVGEKRYLVRFDNGGEKELASSALKVESMVASIPPDVLAPLTRNIREEAVLETADKLLNDDDELEHLPDSQPEEEEAEDVDADQADAEQTDVEQANAEKGNHEEEPPALQENGEDPNGRMPGQLPVGEQIGRDYHSVKKATKERIAAIVGQEVIEGSQKNGSMKWTVIGSHEPDKIVEEFDCKATYGLKDFDMSKFRQSEVLAYLLLSISFFDWKSKVEKMNVAIEKAKAKCKKFSNEEFLTGLGLLIGAAEFSQKGVDLFNIKDDVQDDDDIWQSIRPSPHFEQYMSFSRFKDFQRFLPDIYTDDASEEEINPWYQFSPAVEEFNEIW